MSAGRPLVLMVVAAALVGCQLGTWGPLAVSDEDADFALAAGTGTGRLQIGATCVTLSLEDVDREITLVWRDAQISWDPTARQIVFDDPAMGEIRLSDGDRIAPGGAGIAELGAPDQGAPQPIWLAKPDQSCPRDLFAVHSVLRVEP